MGTPSHKTPTRSSARKDLGDNTYVETAGLPNGILPDRKCIIENMMYLLRPTRAGSTQRSKEDAASILSDILQEHWIFCNIYTLTSRSIKLKILKLYDEFTKLVQTRKDRRKGTYKDTVTSFNTDAVKLFDIFCDNDAIRTRLESWCIDDQSGMGLPARPAHD